MPRCARAHTRGFYSWAGEQPAGVPLTVVELNVLGGSASPAAVDEGTRDVSLVVLTELDTSTAAALDALGWDERFPHRVGRADPGGWSRPPTSPAPDEPKKIR